MYGAISDDIEAAGQRLDEAAGFGQNGVVPAGTNVMRPSEMLQAANDEYRNHTDLLRKIEQSPLRRLLGDKIDVDGFTSYSLPPETVVQRIDAMKPSELGQVRYFMEKNEPEVWGQYKRMIVEDALGAARLPRHLLVPITFRSMREASSERSAVTALKRPNDCSRFSTPTRWPRSAMRWKQPGVWVTVSARTSAAPAPITR